MTPAERELLVLTARRTMAHVVDNSAVFALDRLAAEVEAQATGAASATVTPADLRAVLALVADLAMSISRIAELVPSDAEFTGAIALAHAARRMAASLGDPKLDRAVQAAIESADRRFAALGEPERTP